VTIATNMAGRGTDIVLGGSLEAELAQIPEDDVSARESAKAAWQKRHDEVLASGGLLVIGSERHESRRIDNQLRGRSGRQGDPGASRFYLSLDDTLMRIFTPPRMRAMLTGPSTTSPAVPCRASRLASPFASPSRYLSWGAE